MAKRRRKKSSKCPEPFNTLIDLAQAATLDYIAYKRRQKRGYNKNKIDPYAATGAAFGLGLIDDTEDLIKFGGMLGAMGAFDDDEDDFSYTPLPNNGNIYAWRMNCVDGSDYDIYPEDYETREEYNEALLLAMKTDKLDNPSPISKSTFDDEIEEDDEQGYTYCKVSRIDNGENDYFFPGDLDIKVGDFVLVPSEVGYSKGVVIHMKNYAAYEVPKPIDETETILKKEY